MVVSGSPGALGITNSYDLTPFDSVRIVFTTSFSIFPPEDFEEQYSVFVRRHEHPNDFFYLATPTNGVDEYTTTIDDSLLSFSSTSFEVGASSNAPINAVVVTISSLSIIGQRE